METIRIQGLDRGDVMLYALSTCVMCKSVKRLLNELGVEYSYVDVDLLEREDKVNARNEMRKWHPKNPFPMLIINNEKCIIGDEPEQIRTALEI